LIREDVRGSSIIEPPTNSAEPVPGEFKFLELVEKLSKTVTSWPRI
jgi:hypothetical protein